MRVKIIYPCVCIDHEPTYADPCDYGMPRLYVANSQNIGFQFWYAYCPKCKRGLPGRERKTVYQALKDWNELQIRCWALEYKEFFDDTGTYKADCPAWRKALMRKMEELLCKRKKPR